MTIMGKGKAVDVQAFPTQGHYIWWLFYKYGLVTRDHLRSQGIGNAAQAIDDAERVAGFKFHAEPVAKDKTSKDVIYKVVKGTVPPIEPNQSFWDPTEYDPYDPSYIERTRQYAMFCCGRHPNYLPHGGLIGDLTGHCPVHGLGRCKMLSSSGTQPLRREQSRFDIDADRASFAEKNVRDFLFEMRWSRFEVKQDRKFQTTGNVAIETRRKRYLDRDQWEESGLSVTFADAYAIDTGTAVILVSTAFLKQVVAKMVGEGKERPMGETFDDGEPRTYGVLVPIEVLTGGPSREHR